MGALSLRSESYSGTIKSDDLGYAKSCNELLSMAFIRQICRALPLALEALSFAGVPQLSDAITVLIVEDEPLVRIDLADFFRDKGFIAIEAADAAEAIALLERNGQIRVIVTDVDMPGSMDGLMLARAVADRWPPVHIIVVSGHRAVEITDIPDGSVFFSKPVRQRSLLATVNELLN